VEPVIAQLQDAAAGYRAAVEAARAMLMAEAGGPIDPSTLPPLADAMQRAESAVACVVADSRYNRTHSACLKRARRMFR